MTTRAAAMRCSRRVPPRAPADGRRDRGLLLALAGLAASIGGAAVLLEPRWPGADLGHLAALAASCGVAAAGTRSWLLRRENRPLADLRMAVESVDGGGLGRSAPQQALAGLGRRPDEIGRLSVALRRLINRVSERTAETEALVADIAHEIRNPLASLRSAAEAMRRADEAGRGQLLDIIENDVARLDRLLSEVSRASRLDAELVRERAVEFDLRTTVRELVAHLSPSAAAKGIEVILDVPEEPMPFLGLEARLAQVVVNLVDNAVSLCEPGDALRIWVRRRDERILLVVEDTGPGIPPGAAERIFHRFYSDRPGSGAGENCGLGLAISRQIVEAHGGLIWAENIRPTEDDPLSEPLGARFAVMLPLGGPSAIKRW